MALTAISGSTLCAHVTHVYNITYPCYRSASVIRNGMWFCRMHDPNRVRCSHLVKRGIDSGAKCIKLARHHYRDDVFCGQHYPPFMSSNMQYAEFMEMIDGIFKNRDRANLNLGRAVYDRSFHDEGIAHAPLRSFNLLCHTFGEYHTHMKSMVFSSRCGETPATRKFKSNRLRLEAKIDRLLSDVGAQFLELVKQDRNFSERVSIVHDYNRELCLSFLVARECQQSTEPFSGFNTVEQPG